jgi:selenocysteine-specific elongation factor
MTVVIGTAGHIDHGKTSLLRALTGIDADRLPEEQRRGMTIDVGYAHMDLPDGGSVDFVDVPGHERLIGNMLVGAGEIDGALVVVAADDGPRAQTVEHLELLDGLEIRDGLVVITKADLVADGRRDDVRQAVRGLVDATALRGAPILVASSVTGQGVDAIRAAVIDLARRVSARGTAPGEGRPRLAIDRIFAIRGRGIVVTGSLRGGAIARGDALRIVPGGVAARVREVQVHGRTVDRAGPGRVALNLAGIDAASLHRGQVLTRDPRIDASDRLLVTLTQVAPLAGRPVPLPGDRARLQLHLGTDQVGAAVGRGGSASTSLPGGAATALLRLERPVAASWGDRFVLRRPSPGRAEAGGRVLDVHPPTGPSRRRMTPVRLARLAGARTLEDQALAQLDLHGAIAEPGVVGLAADIDGLLAERALAIVAVRHSAEPGAPGVPVAALRAQVASELRRLVALDTADAARAAAATLDALVADGRLGRTGDAIHEPGRTRQGPSAELEAAMERLEAAIDVATPPSLGEAMRAAGCPPGGLRALEAAGRIVRVDDDLAWSAAAWQRLSDTALRLAAAQPLTPADLRDATGTSRKYVMALLEDLGRRAILVRTPAGHVPGPRAAQLHAAALGAGSPAGTGPAR